MLGEGTNGWDFLVAIIAAVVAVSSVVVVPGWVYARRAKKRTEGLADAVGIPNGRKLWRICWSCCRGRTGLCRQRLCMRLAAASSSSNWNDAGLRSRNGSRISSGASRRWNRRPLRAWRTERRRSSTLKASQSKTATHRLVYASSDSASIDGAVKTSSRTETPWSAC